MNTTIAFESIELVEVPVRTEQKIRIKGDLYSKYDALLLAAKIVMLADGNLIESVKMNVCESTYTWNNNAEFFRIYISLKG